MQYQIEHGAIPPKRGRPEAWSPERAVMEKMEPSNESFFRITDPERVNAARCAARAMTPRRFTIQKLQDGSGWGVWRLE